jgi:hypothetical protein
MIGQVSNTKNWKAKYDDQLHERTGQGLKRNWFLKVEVFKDEQACREESLNLGSENRRPHDFLFNLGYEFGVTKQLREDENSNQHEGANDQAKDKCALPNKYRLQSFESSENVV